MVCNNYTDDFWVWRRISCDYPRKNSPRGLLFLGLAIILGFISSLGATLVESKLKTRLKLTEDSLSTVKEKIDEMEKLEKEDIDTLVEKVFM